MLSKPSASSPSGVNATETTPSRARLSAGEVVGEYRLILDLASGGMASVHAAVVERRDVEHRLAAVKLLHQHLVDDPTHRAMFLDEARIASGVRHPNVCRILDFGEDA